MPEIETRPPDAVVRQLLDGIAGGPSESLAELYAEDVVVELPFAPPGGLRLVGRDEVRRHFRAAGSAPFSLTPTNVVLHRTDDPELVIAEYDYDGVVRNSGRAFRVANVQIVRVRNGLIVASRDFHDHSAMSTAARTP